MGENRKYKAVMPVQLRFSDFDRFGHVNNAVYFSYSDSAKCEYIYHVIPNLKIEKTGVVVVSLKADFQHEIHREEAIVVETAVTRIGRKSFTMMQRVIDPETQEVKCICESVLVFFDLENRQTIVIKPEWIEAMNEFEGRELRDL
ncbi:MAG: acyl-CoA thioesterase [Bacteroidaceae bacterium]|nr:acyl-CoA thioesterase [Bacteroidaceae bacterium]